MCKTSQIIQRCLEDAREAVHRSDEAGANEQETRELRTALRAIIEAIELLVVTEESDDNGVYLSTEAKSLPEILRLLAKHGGGSHSMVTLSREQLGRLAEAARELAVAAGVVPRW